MPGNIYIRGKSALTSNDANYFYDMIQKWKPRKQVWPFVYGDDILGGTAGVTSTYVGYYFRRKLQMAHIARLAVHAPAFAIPCVFAMTLQQAHITPKLLRASNCPLCDQWSSALVQVIAGFVVPVGIVSVTTFHYSDRALTYPVPSITEAPKEVAQLWWKIFRPNARVILAYGVLQIVAAMFITSEKQKCLADIEDKVFARKKIAI